MPFSFSQLSTYRTCPRQYEFASIKKLPRGISAGESFGSSVHNTLSKWGKLEVEKGKRKVEKDQLALFTEEDSVIHSPLSVAHLTELWHQSFIVEGYESKEDADKARMRGEVIMGIFFDWWSEKKREVIAIEKGFSLDDLGIRGRFDRVERTDAGITVIDYKTSKPRTQEEVDQDLQLSIYALGAEEMFGEPCCDLSLLFLREDGITEMHTTRSPQQLKEAKEQIAKFSEAILGREFAPTPSEPVCKRCPYRSVCNASVV